MVQRWAKQDTYAAGNHPGSRKPQYTVNAWTSMSNAWTGQKFGLFSFLFF